MKTENKCKNCAHFLRGGKFKHDVTIVENNEADFGFCLNKKVCSDFVSGWAHNDEVYSENDGVYATCDEWRGELRIGINFGCIHFKSK